MSDFSPIALFVYRRPVHARQVLEALAQNPEAEHSELHIFSDGAKSTASTVELEEITEVRKVIRERKWCGDVHLHEAATNLGLAKSIIDGVTRILVDHERIIVMEDDIVTSPGFLAYMNEALELYAGNERVMHISAFLPTSSYRALLPKSFFHPMMWCWGWATWRDSWMHLRTDGSKMLEDLRAAPGGVRGFDLGGAFRLSDQLIANIEGRLTTWAVFWATSIYLNGGLSLNPGKSLVRNIGLDNSGENCGQSMDYATDLGDRVPVCSQRVSKSLMGDFYFRSFFRYGRNSRISHRLRIAAGCLKHRIAIKLMFFRDLALAFYRERLLPK